MSDVKKDETKAVGAEAAETEAAVEPTEEQLSENEVEPDKSGKIIPAGDMAHE